MKNKLSQNEFLEYIKESLEPFGATKYRAMFGGYGIYKNDLMFALIANSELYFKADNEAATYFQSFGSEAFTYDSKGKKVKMSYYKVPPEILEDQGSLQTWCDLAYSGAMALQKHFI
jgi:DNA transformation protein and related proteins